ncbi:MAG: ATP phosphoribosyltransferase regulatory subunit, partial [Chitinispirillaceae bacterium]|nr:ATP phosphoribosyltransferase regulatory subunit [Chitinispirillaceae bacterium]
MMAIPSGPKGTRDFYPELMAQQTFLFSSWEKTCHRYGFERYDGPMFEHLELYRQKSGDEIEMQLYAFTDKKGRELALRPEMTPTLARMTAAAGSNLKWPLRWYSIPRLFRYEKMQKGRLREFFQLNMDIL